MTYNLNGDIITDKIKIYNCDCMELLKQTPDKYYDLAIVDPPYGININPNMGLKKGKRKKHKNIDWDNTSPNKAYFIELFRISKNQIIWGGNYFELPPTFHFIFWDKLNPEGLSFSDGEYAWTSFNKAIRKYCFNNKTGDKIHPTQKPVALYKWLLDKYAKPGDKILDTHLGSMSIAIACHDYDFDLTGCELDTEYYEQGKKRVQNHVMQLKMF